MGVHMDCRAGPQLLVLEQFRALLYCRHLCTATSAKTAHVCVIVEPTQALTHLHTGLGPQHTRAEAQQQGIAQVIMQASGVRATSRAPVPSLKAASCPGALGSGLLEISKVPYSFSIHSFAKKASNQVGRLSTSAPYLLDLPSPIC